VREFEEALAAYCGAKYAVAVNSGTAALYLSYRVCPASWAVTTSPLTFMATANAALMAGGNVRFVDVDPQTGNAVFTGKGTGLLVPVHYAGRACAIPDGIVIEDACHALGAMDFDGCSRVGSCAHTLATCFSFHPVKPITTGEGGAVTTNDQGFANEVRSLRDHGRRDGLMVSLSGNYRMPDINAVLGLSQLKRCDEMRERRFELAKRYARQIDAWDGQLNGQQYSAWHLYPVRIKNGRRDEVKRKLNEQGIGAQVHYNPPVHLHPYYRTRFQYREGSFPNAEAWAAEELSLPLHAQMTEQDVERAVNALREALG
jgi:dTDP-4-amino-4,6-dideoxygalactose transaminase